MKVVVAIKTVAVLDDEFELEDGQVDADDIEWELNEWDSFSLQAAIDLRDESGDGGEVVAITVGADEAEEALLACLAKGADRGIRIWSDELEDADALAVARALAAAVEREQPDLVLAGVQSSDAVNGATGIAMAGLLDLAHVAVVKEIRHLGGRLEVVRELEGGLAERIAIDLPALLTVQTGINEPTYATLRAIKQARNKPLELLDLSALGLSPGQLAEASGSRRRGLVPLEAGQAEMLDGDAGAVAQQVAAIVKEKLA